VARALNVNLEHFARCTLWINAFPLTKTNIEALVTSCAENDFGVFVYSNEDILKMRGEEYSAARDNVIFESGLFVGMHGRDRTFILSPHNIEDFHIPTDLLGVTLATYDAERVAKDSISATSTAATRINKAIENGTWSQLRLDIKPEGKDDPRPNATYPLKLFFTVTNRHNHAVAIESLNFRLNPRLRFAPRDSSVLPDRGYSLKFLVGKKKEGVEERDRYEAHCILEPGESRIAWVSIDRDMGKAAIEDALKDRSVGTWSYRCVWFQSPFVTCAYEQEF
jgi:hypothetical protein